MNPTLPRPTLGVVIRFKNSAATLPAVLTALRRQTLQPDLILGVNNQSADASPEILRRAGAKIIAWTQPYSHPRVLNFALRHCPTDLVLVLSSHTVLQSPDAVEKLVAALHDPRTACASGKWDDDPFYTDAIDWGELQAKGLKFGSIYSNSMGLLRRSLWEQIPFSESVPTMEDCGWALEQAKRGYLCRRVKFDFHHQRNSQDRVFIFAALTFRLAAQHGLRVAWLGPRASLAGLFRAGFQALRGRGTRSSQQALLHYDRLRAWAFGRYRRAMAQWNIGMRIGMLRSAVPATFPWPAVLRSMVSVWATSTGVPAGHVTMKVWSVLEGGEPESVTRTVMA